MDTMVFRLFEQAAEASAPTASEGFSLPWCLVYAWGQASGKEAGITMGFLVLGVFLCILTGYLLGSLNGAILFTRIKYHMDIRERGVFDADAISVYQVFGLKEALPVLSLDILKTLAALGAGFLIYAQSGMAISAFFCLLGHAFPLYFRFKGGKGLICLFVSTLLLNPWTFLILFAIFLAILFASRYLSVASIMYGLLYPVLLNRFTKNTFQADWFLYMAILTAVLVFFTHRNNIRNLKNNEEAKFSFRKKEQESSMPDIGLKEKPKKRGK